MDWTTKINQVIDSIRKWQSSLMFVEDSLITVTGKTPIVGVLTDLIEDMENQHLLIQNALQEKLDEDLNNSKELTGLLLTATLNAKLGG